MLSLPAPIAPVQPACMVLDLSRSLKWDPRIPADIPAHQRREYIEGWEYGHEAGFHYESDTAPACLSPMARLGYHCGHKEGQFQRMADDHDREEEEAERADRELRNEYREEFLAFVEEVHAAPRYEEQELRGWATGGHHAQEDC